MACCKPMDRPALQVKRCCAVEVANLALAAPDRPAAAAPSPEHAVIREEGLSDACVA